MNNLTLFKYQDEETQGDESNTYQNQQQDSLPPFNYEVRNRMQTVTPASLPGFNLTAQEPADVGLVRGAQNSQSMKMKEPLRQWTESSDPDSMHKKSWPGHFSDVNGASTCDMLSVPSGRTQSKPFQGYPSMNKHLGDGADFGLGNGFGGRGSGSLPYSTLSNTDAPIHGSSLRFVGQLEGIRFNRETSRDRMSCYARRISKAAPAKSNKAVFSAKMARSQFGHSGLNYGRTGGIYSLYPSQGRSLSGNVYGSYSAQQGIFAGHNHSNYGAHLPRNTAALTIPDIKTALERNNFITKKEEKCSYDDTGVRTTGYTGRSFYPTATNNRTVNLIGSAVAHPLSGSSSSLDWHHNSSIAAAVSTADSNDISSAGTGGAYFGSVALAAPTISDVKIALERNNFITKKQKKYDDTRVRATGYSDSSLYPTVTNSHTVDFIGTSAAHPLSRPSSSLDWHHNSIIATPTSTINSSNISSAGTEGANFSSVALAMGHSASQNDHADYSGINWSIYSEIPQGTETSNMGHHNYNVCGSSDIISTNLQQQPTVISQSSAQYSPVEQGGINVLQSSATDLMEMLSAVPLPPTEGTETSNMGHHNYNVCGSSDIISTNLQQQPTVISQSSAQYSPAEQGGTDVLQSSTTDLMEMLSAVPLPPTEGSIILYKSSASKGGANFGSVSLAMDHSSSWNNHADCSGINQDIYNEIPQGTLNGTSNYFGMETNELHYNAGATNSSMGYYDVYGSSDIISTNLLPQPTVISQSSGIVHEAQWSPAEQGGIDMLQSSATDLMEMLSAVPLPTIEGYAVMNDPPLDYDDNWNFNIESELDTGDFILVEPVDDSNSPPSTQGINGY